MSRNDFGMAPSVWLVVGMTMEFSLDPRGRADPSTRPARRGPRGRRRCPMVVQAVERRDQSVVVSARHPRSTFRRPCQRHCPQPSSAVPVGETVMRQTVEVVPALGRVDATNDGFLIGERQVRRRAGQDRRGRRRVQCDDVLSRGGHTSRITAGNGSAQQEQHQLHGKGATRRTSRRYSSSVYMRVPRSRAASRHR